MRNLMILALVLSGCGAIDRAEEQAKDYNGKEIPGASPSPSPTFAPQAQPYRPLAEGFNWQLISMSTTFDEALCPPGYELPNAPVWGFVDYFQGKYNATGPDVPSYWSSFNGTIGQMTFEVRYTSGESANIKDSPVSERHIVVCVKQKGNNP